MASRCSLFWFLVLFCFSHRFVLFCFVLFCFVLFCFVLFYFVCLFVLFCFCTLNLLFLDTKVQHISQYKSSNPKKDKATKHETLHNITNYV